MQNHDNYINGRILEVIQYEATTYVLREETMHELLNIGLTRQNMQHPEYTSITLETETPTLRRHHTQQYRVRFEDHLTIDSSNNLERVPRDESFIPRGRVEIGENEFKKYEKK